MAHFLGVDIGAPDDDRVIAPLVDIDKRKPQDHVRDFVLARLGRDVHTRAFEF